MTIYPCTPASLTMAGLLLGFAMSLPQGSCFVSHGTAAPTAKPRGPWERQRTRMIHRVGARKIERHEPVVMPAEPVQVVNDLPYGPDPCQRLDVYLPTGSGFPVVMYVHGGSWISEDKHIYEVVGRYLAANGVAAVLVNYRLPPAVTCEGELEDVSQAFAWTYHNMPGYGGDPCRLFLCGHSAGAHMVSVLATNPMYLGRVDLTSEQIRGVISIAGPYRINVNLRPYGLGYVFKGMDHKAISPLNQARPGLPPFLILNDWHGSRYLRLQARRFNRRLQTEGVPSERYLVPYEDHYGQVLDIAIPGKTQGPRILEFISQLH